MMLKQNEIRNPKSGINMIILTRIKPTITIRIGEEFFLPKAFIRLSPKKKKRTIRPKTLMIMPRIMRQRRMGIPIRTKQSNAAKITSPVKTMILNRPVPKTGQKDFLIWEEAKEI
jgi:hypothetical protein